jgi:hypothetical protein
MRRIVSAQLQTTQSADIDGYSDRVVKYIPADVVGAWVAITALIQGNQNASPAVLWVMFVVMVAITAAWTLRQTNLAGRPPALMQTAISTGSFIVWVVALGGPFTTLTWYQPLYGSLLLITYTLVVALVVPTKS